MANIIETLKQRQAELRKGESERLAKVEERFFKKLEETLLIFVELDTCDLVVTIEQSGDNIVVGVNRGQSNWQNEFDFRDVAIIVQRAESYGFERLPDENGAFVLRATLY